MSQPFSGRRVIAVASLLLAWRTSAAEPFAQLSSTERALIAAARATAQARCDCNTARKHGAYMRCVAQALKAEAAAGRLPRKPMHQAMKCAARSTCGRAGAVTCCKTSRRGRTKCAIVPAAKCKAPRGGTACASSFSSWCDAAEHGCSPAALPPHDTQCCLPTSPGGAILDDCEFLKPDECTTEGGVVVGDGTCDPNPCPPASTTTTTTVTSTTGTSETTTTVTTTSTTLPEDTQCCLPTSAGGTILDDCELLKPDECASAGGQDAGRGSCTPNPCPLTSSTTTTTLAGRCGDGIVQPELNEQCDPPWSRNPAQCPALPGRRFGPECGDDCRCATTTTSTQTTTTTTTVTSTTSTSETTTTVTTTSTTLPEDTQCCLPTSAGGTILDDCELLKPDECASAGGQDAGRGSCTPNPCPLTSSTTTTTLAGRCGDGIVQPELNEQCDPPWSRNPAQCPALPGRRFGPECGDDCRCVTATTSTQTSTTTTTAPSTTTTTASPSTTTTSSSTTLETTTSTSTSTSSPTSSTTTTTLLSKLRHGHGRRDHP